MEQLQIHYVGPCARVHVERPGMNRLAVDSHSPVPVFEGADEAKAAELENPKRWVPLKVAQRLVEHGSGSWEWVLLAGTHEVPAAILSGPLPEGFPSRQQLAAAGIEALEQVPRSEGELIRVPGLVEAPPGERPQKSQLRAAAHRILDALDARIRAGGNG